MKYLLYIFGISLLFVTTFTTAVAKNEVTVVVFEDFNRDGIQQKDEKGIKGVEVKFRHSGTDGIFRENLNTRRPGYTDSYYTKKTGDNGQIKFQLGRGVLYMGIDKDTYYHVPKKEKRMRVNYDGKKETFYLGIIQKFENSPEGIKQKAKEEKEKQKEEKKKKEAEEKKMIEDALKKAEEERKKTQEQHNKKTAEFEIEFNSAPEEQKKDLPYYCSINYDKCTLGTGEGFLKYADDLACEGIIKKRYNCEGYGCDQNINRAEVAGIGIKLRGLSIDKSYVCKNKFKDITPDHTSWICRTAEIAESNGISWVDKDKLKFWPDNDYNRANSIGELMKAVCMPIPKEDDIEPFDEDLKYTGWQKRIIRSAQKYGITSRNDREFNPGRKITRGEVFVIASKLLEWAEKTGGCRTHHHACK